jgi:hypothetical protein
MDMMILGRSSVTIVEGLTMGVSMTSSNLAMTGSISDVLKIV